MQKNTLNWLKPRQKRYSSESTQRELSNEYQHDRVQMVFKNLCVLMISMKVALAWEGLRREVHLIHIHVSQQFRVLARIKTLGAQNWQLNLSWSDKSRSSEHKLVIFYMIEVKFCCALQLFSNMRCYYRIVIYGLYITVVILVRI